MEQNLQKDLSEKPQGLPEKFWDENAKTIKTDELIADYVSLISRDDNLIEVKQRNIPESFDKYEIKSPHPMLSRDDDVFKKFYEHGFSNDQAQLVYDLANEHVIPYLDNLAQEYEMQREFDDLQKYFGSEEKFNAVSRQISQWAKQNIEASVYDALAKTSDGVVALYKMMSSKEPTIGKERDVTEELTEESLKAMMQDPRYWKEKDKSYMDKVTRGFQRLYPEK